VGVVWAQDQVMPEDFLLLATAPVSGSLGKTRPFDDFTQNVEQLRQAMESVHGIKESRLSWWACADQRLPRDEAVGRISEYLEKDPATSKIIFYAGVGDPNTGNW
jgi:hypothetical protein